MPWAEVPLPDELYPVVVVLQVVVLHVQVSHLDPLAVIDLGFLLVVNLLLVLHVEASSHDPFLLMTALAPLVESSPFFSLSADSVSSKLVSVEVLPRVLLVGVSFLPFSRCLSPSVSVRLGRQG